MKHFFLLLFMTLPLTAHAESFDQWKAAYAQRAQASGLTASQIERALYNISLDERVIELDRKQPEGHMTLLEYVEKTVNERRVEKGIRMLADHRNLLVQVERASGVPKEIIVSLWGKETDFGAVTGNFNTVNSLATLAYEGRRRDMFERELTATIKLASRLGRSPEEIVGSWAGALGQCQFMPTVYLGHGVDGDGDNRVDLWRSMPDIFYSMANLLRHEGWQAGIPWGARIDMPASVPDTIIGRDKPFQNAAYWRRLGVRLDGQLGEKLRLYQPDGRNGPAYVITPNFDVLMRWNRSGYFATAVGRLADKLSY